MTAPETYYSLTRISAPARPALAGAADCATLVIGGGFAGIWTALELARAGEDVMVIEAETLGHGASGRNGGIVCPGFACGAEAITDRAGPETAEALHRLSIEGVTRLREAIVRHRIAGAAPEPGLFHLRRYDSADDLKAEVAEASRRFGYRLDYLDRAALGAHLASPRYRHALYDPNAFHIHPLNALLGLAAAVEGLGGRIHETTPALALARTGAGWRVATPGGAIAAARVVVATGGYTGTLVPRLRRAILPVATYMMMTEAAPDAIAAAIRTRAALADDRRAGDYYRTVDGGRRLLWGGRITTRAAAPGRIERELRAEMAGAYPELSGLRTERVWSGLMGYARHLMPQLGEAEPGLWHITAFGGHGLNTTAAAGSVLAEAMLGRSRRIDLFAPFGLDWAGGPAGLLAAQLTYWKLRLQDRWRERR
ncbi:MAG: FAD-binding oxidoreductase [Defluviimonas sp.]|uniref:NAD(P)/FAD-dependent oxidoreductase n=1 Tax=Albidovulum sp. TaxID=1872424 RepID=UPI002A2DF062|nr:FAD-binding oxidoreductase [Defluviimonas sp.]